MPDIKTRFSKWDILPIAAVAALALAVFLLFLPITEPAAQVEIYQGGNLLTTLPLDKDTIYTVTGAYTNIVTVKDGQVAVTQSNCPGGDCKNCGWSDTAGKSIVCLPNGLEVRVVAGNSNVDIVVR